MAKTLAPSKTAKVNDRDPKGLKFMSIVGTAYSKAGLTEEEAQRVNDAAGLKDLIAGFIEENRHTDKFKDEEVESSYGYLSGYKRPKGLIQQSNDLQILFPGGIGMMNQDMLGKIEREKLPLPEHTDDWFAIPNWIKHPKIFGTSYAQAVQTVLDKIKETRGRFYNWREGQINDKQLRQTSRSVEFWKRLSEAQGDPDILIVAAQFGLRHRGRSVRRAREIMTGTAGEFGLGAFATGIMLLTHPERLKQLDDLWIDCAGDEFDDPGSGVRFDDVPSFFWHHDGVEFGTRWCDRADDYCGSVSGFFPQ